MKGGKGWRGWLGNRLEPVYAAKGAAPGFSRPTTRRVRWDDLFRQYFSYRLN